jgi:hypothetical protein
MSRARDLADSADKDIAGTLTLDGLSVSGDVAVNTDTLFVDASADSVGIGTSSPSETLTVAQGTTERAIAICSSDANVGGFIGASGESGSTNKLIINGSRGSGGIVFQTVSDEKMRIDASGNLLVGATTADQYNLTTTTNAGVVLKKYSGGGKLEVSRDYDCATLNRLSTDGTIIDLRKNGTTVGSIGTKSASLYIGTGETNFRFNDSGDVIYAAGSDGSSRDAAVNLGLSGGRFKDLYLSGGVYLGGTGSANKLDDYEEGTWTPTVTNSGTNPTFTYVNREGTYTKVGRMVTVVCNLRLNVTSVGSGSCYIGGLPFSTATSYAGVAWGIDNAFYNGYAVSGGYLSGATVFTGNTLRVLNGGYITFTATYETS